MPNEQSHLPGRRRGNWPRNACRLGQGTQGTRPGDAAFLVCNHGQGPRAGGQQLFRSETDNPNLCQSGEITSEVSDYVRVCINSGIDPDEPDVFERYWGSDARPCFDWICEDGSVNMPDLCHRFSIAGRIESRNISWLIWA
jgi:hypothetical protein